MTIWRRAGRPCGLAIGAHPAPRAAGDLFDLRRTWRSARQPVAHAGRVTTRSGDLERLRTGAATARDRSFRTRDPGRRRRRTEPDAQPRARRGASRRAPARRVARRSAAPPDEADTHVERTQN